jgi:winged helix DNA-binding protein
MELTRDQMAWHRIQRSGLVAPFENAEEVARSTVGVQSQFVPPAGLAIANRVDGAFTQDDLDRLLHDKRSLVRTWGQRNTVHVYAVEDWSTVVGGSQVLSTYQERAAKALGVDVADMAAAVERVGEILATRDRACRADLVEEDPLLEPWFKYGNGIVMDLARVGAACHAGLEGGRSYFAARRRWLPDLEWQAQAVHDACVALARRYFAAYGPATIKDFQFWLGSKAAPAREAVAALGDELVEVRVGGEASAGAEAMLALAADVVPMAEPPPLRSEWPLRLLHRFDPLVLAHKDKSWLVEADHYKSVWRKAGYVEAVVFRGGRMEGTWRYDKKGKGLILTVIPFGRISVADRKRLGRLAEPVAAYFERTLTEVVFA